jgi:hypothetical protein
MTAAFHMVGARPRGIALPDFSFIAATMGYSTASSPTITLPAFLPGDIVVIVNYYRDTLGNSSTLVIPAGFTEACFDNQSTLTAGGGRISFRKMQAGDATTVSIESGGTSASWMAATFRPSFPIPAGMILVPNDVDSFATAGDPAAQIIKLNGEPTPVLALAHFRGTVPPTAYGTLTLVQNTTSGATAQYLGYQCFNKGSTPANISIDTGDSGQPNLLQGCFLSLVETAKRPTSLTWVSHSLSEAATIAIPAGAAAGDLGILLDGPSSTSGQPIPTTVVPAGWKELLNYGRAPDSAARMIISTKVLTAGDIGATITGMVGTSLSNKTLIVLRPDKPINNVEHASGWNDVTAANPALQIMQPQNSYLPGIALSHITNFSADANPSGTMVTTGSYIPGITANRRKTYYKIINSAPGDLTIDMGDAGALNAMQSAYVWVV